MFVHTNFYNSCAWTSWSEPRTILTIVKRVYRRMTGSMLRLWLKRVHELQRTHCTKKASHSWWRGANNCKMETNTHRTVYGMNKGLFTKQKHCTGQRQYGLASWHNFKPDRFISSPRFRTGHQHSDFLERLPARRHSRRVCSHNRRTRGLQILCLLRT